MIPIDITKYANIGMSNYIDQYYRTSLRLMTDIHFNVVKIIFFYVCPIPGAAPLLLLPENIRIRRFNLQTEAYHDFLREEDRIVALDYDWDHNNTGYSKKNLLHKI